MNDNNVRGSGMRWGLRSVAVLEAFKGLLALASALALFGFANETLQALANEWVRHLHLNPARRYPGIFLSAASLGSAHLIGLAAAALAYALFRFAEAYGLWRQRQWAWWLGLISAAIYVPAEIAWFINAPGWLSAFLLTVNAIVLDIFWRGRQRSL